MNLENKNNIKTSKKVESIPFDNEEEILNSNNVTLIAKYAKENRSKKAIDKVRELLEFARKSGEKVVQNFFKSFKECEAERKSYLEFLYTESGQKALSILEKMPEPFQSIARGKLTDYRRELEYNIHLFKRHKGDAQGIWKEIFGFDYYNVPNLKERFKNFLFKDVPTISKDFYMKDALYIKQDPFAINFFVEDAKNFYKACGDNTKDCNKVVGFSASRGESNINVIKIDELENDKIKSDTTHESEHAIHAKVNNMNVFEGFSSWSFDDNFDEYKIAVNNESRTFFLNSLEHAKDEIFAYQKDGTDKADVEALLFYKIEEPLFKEREEEGDLIFDEIRDRNPKYDYNEEYREVNYKIIEINKILSDTEKQKLKDSIDFLQSEYERVLKNMIEVIYEKVNSRDISIEFFRNVPINELWKYSDGRYNRTDFIIKPFKF